MKYQTSNQKLSFDYTAVRGNYLSGLNIYKPVLFYNNSKTTVTFLADKITIFPDFGEPSFEIHNFMNFNWQLTIQPIKINQNYILINLRATSLKSSLIKARIDILLNGKPNIQNRQLPPWIIALRFYDFDLSSFDKYTEVLPVSQGFVSGSILISSADGNLEIDQPITVIANLKITNGQLSTPIDLGDARIILKNPQQELKHFSKLQLVFNSSEFTDSPLQTKSEKSINASQLRNWLEKLSRLSQIQVSLTLKDKIFGISASGHLFNFPWLDLSGQMYIHPQYLKVPASQIQTSPDRFKINLHFQGWINNFGTELYFEDKTILVDLLKEMLRYQLRFN